MLTTQVDELFALRQKRLEAQKEVDAMHDEENRITDWIIDAMNAEGMSTLGGVTVTATLKHGRKPVVEDWSQLQRHIRETGDIDLLQMRLKESAVTERWQTGDDVPGVTAREVDTLSLSKVK